jgi:large subunit ribosomal protein L3
VKERQLGLIGKKLGMTTVYNEKGDALGVTVLLVGPCHVMGKRTVEKNGYRALQLGFGEKKPIRVKKPELKTYAFQAEKPPALVREMRIPESLLEQFEPGSSIGLGDLALKSGDYVDVTGVSIGKGFAGVMKRHNFAGFRASHGTHEYFRHGGSIGCRKWPGRVFKLRKMPGQMGNRKVTMQNLKIVQVRPDDHVILVLGSVPGCKNSYITLRPAIKG